jgi:glycosyltransferase involved in cell wall biosynthesis
MGSPITIGVLHVGRPESGVRRYARIVTDAIATQPGVRVVEADAGLLEGRRGGLGARGRVFTDAGADVVQMQWNRRGWGKGPRSAWRFIDFRRAWQGPLVVTLHDVFDRAGLRRRWLEPEVWSLRWLGRSADRLIVHSEAEVERLEGIVPAAKLRVIPHFVEQRVLPLTPEEARARLGVEGRRVVTLLGFIYGRKGHKPTVEAIPSLPDDVLVVYAGGPVAGRRHVLQTVEERVTELGIADRLRVTGYLSEEDMEAWIAATHLAILPFRDLSASGSLSTWIAAGKPLLVSDLPGFREYDARVPGSLRIVSDLSAEGLASAIRAALDGDLPEVDPRVVALREQLTTDRTAERYLAVDREVAGR